MGDYWRSRRYVPSQPRSVEGGIRAQSRRGDIGETWWSRRFIAILESFDYASRLQRGRHYARRGQVMDLEVRKGVVEAHVQGSRPRPYRVRLGVEVLSERDWTRAEKAMASKALFMAKLLAGEMPREIEEAFAACKLSLFPTSGRQLSSACSCPDWASPCKHVAATFYILAEAFDADPFLVFKWRGRTKEELLENLGALREEGQPAVEPSAAADAEPPLAQRLDDFWEAGPELTDVQVRPWTAVAPEEVVRRMGPVGVTVQGRDVSELLAGAYRAMSAAAKRLALGDVQEPDQPAD
jgi:uncharacterized Zn finger protein